MTNRPRLGSKVRAHRRRASLTQVELARRLGISPSYLNLIEHNQRPLTAPLLIKLAKELELDFDDFAADSDARLAHDLIEVFADPFFDEHALVAAEMGELASSHPSVARAVLDLYDAWQQAREEAEGMAARMADDQEFRGVTRSRLPSEDVNDFIQKKMNYFAELEEAAEQLWKDAELEMGARYRGMVRYLESLGVEVTVGAVGSNRGALRRFDPERRRVILSEALPPNGRNMQLAVQIGLLTQHEYFDAIVEEADLPNEQARVLTRLVLANYFAGAVLMPYRPMLAAAQGERYDVELIGHRFGTSFEQVCHRLTTLRRPGEEGVPFHMLRVDMAGNISKRFSASGIRFARFAGACPRWNVFTAFQTPGRITTQVSTMPDGVTFFCVARTVAKGRGGYHSTQSLQAIGLGCQLEYARELVYGDGLDIDTLDRSVPVGVTCRLCERTDCDQRAFPSLRQPLRVDENVRGVSFYSPPESGGMRGPARDAVEGPGANAKKKSRKKTAKKKATNTRNRATKGA